MSKREGFYAEGITSRTFRRLNKVGPVLIQQGPYKRKRRAEKEATKMRQHRAVFDIRDGKGYQDFGPTYDRKTIRVFEVPND